MTQSQFPFQIIFNPVHGINTGMYYTISHPQNITISIQDVFVTYLNKLIEHIKISIHHYIFFLT